MARVKSQPFLSIQCVGVTQLVSGFLSEVISLCVLCVWCIFERRGVQGPPMSLSWFDILPLQNFSY